ncbi:MAG: polyprenyl diphosphate synthase [Planctomycetes bacterium]|nr:polyprenyl diphosphate synthase [Planctomycetota bacterium]
MDGNGRWASSGGLLRLRGHEQGAQTVRNVVTLAAKWGIQHLTLFAFSTENWKRPKSETTALMSLLKRFLKSEKHLLLEKGIQLRGLGMLEDLPDDVQATLAEVQQATARGEGMVLRLALSYGGRQEIVEAARSFAKEIAEGSGSWEDLNEEEFSGRMLDPEMPDPDLIIRTAGEQRLSNFLLWQASYAEFFFSELLWPDFGEDEFRRALESYQGRVRRFGEVVETPMESTN